MAIGDPYRTLQDIREAVIVDSKAGATTNTTLNSQVDRFINEGYNDLIARRKREFLDEDYFFTLDAKVSGECQVTNGSTTVTFDSSTTIPNTPGYLYKLFIAGQSEVYDIASAGTSTVTLASAFTGATDTATTATIVQSGLTLSDEVKTVYEATHDYYGKLVDLRGVQQFKERVQYDNQRTGYANMATISGVDSTGAKELYFYPYADSEYTLKIHGSKYFSQLTADDDEPLIPQEYRVLLYFYALTRVYASISRNVDLYTDATNQYNKWLARLDSEVRPAQDEPGLVYDKTMRFNNFYRRHIRGTDVETE